MVGILSARLLASAPPGEGQAAVLAVGYPVVVQSVDLSGEVEVAGQFVQVVAA